MLLPIEEKTKELKPLLNRAKNSALDAWNAGEILNNILHEYFNKNEYKFENYTNKEFGVSFITARKYIDLYTKIDKRMITENMLVTHLYPLLDVDDVSLRIQLVEIICSMKDKQRKITGKDVDEIINLIEVSENIKTRDDIEKEFIKIIDENKHRRATSRYSYDRKGKPIKSEYFSEVLDLFPNIPIDEQGLVGLFCSMFSLLREKEFKLRKYLIKFSRIEYIRAEFPDGQIVAVNAKNPDEEITINVEFEYESRNYIRHGHHKVKNKKCDLIICWHNNLAEDKSLEGIPLILSIKKVLSEGKIELINPKLK